MTSWIKQTALREWRGALRYWVMGWLLSCLICVVARPFQTDQLGFIIAVGYWLLINGIAVIILRGFGPMLGGKFVLTALLGSAVFSLLFTALMLINELLYGFDLPVHFFASTFLISLVVFSIVWVAQSRHSMPTPSPISKFENRLSKYQTAQLWAITAQDHYLNIQTDQGSELILMRLSDALVELADRDGVQIHSSHWVVRIGIAKNNANSVTLHNGEVLPISRSNGPVSKAFFAQRLP